MRDRILQGFLLATIGACVIGAPAPAFTTTWTDQFGETTYEISGPDAAAVGESLLVALSVTDAIYPEDWVAASWSFSVDGVQYDGGFSIYTSGGTWTAVYPFLYVEQGNHTFTFRAQDLGHGGGHDYEWFEISGTTDIVSQPEACCFEDCHCELLDPNLCLEQDGIPMGSGVTCDPNPCDCPPLGACCIGEPSQCYIMMLDECLAMGGAYQGDGTSCDPDPCVPVAAQSTTWGRIRATYRRSVR